MSAGALYRVIRFCCTSGMCIECRAGGDRARRKEVVQASRLTKTMAEKYVKGWVSYGARMEVMR